MYLSGRQPPLRGLDPEVPELFEDILNRGLSLRFQATGRSMAPFLGGGEILTVRKVPSSSLCIGDLIFFRDSRDALILHRLVRRIDAGDGNVAFQTKGDASVTFDEPVQQRKILGKVCGIERAGRSGRLKYVDMELTSRRLINRLVALLGLIKSAWYFSSFRRNLKMISKVLPGR